MMQMPHALDIFKNKCEQQAEGHSFLRKQLQKESYALQLQNRIEVESHTKGGPPSLHIGLSGKSCSLESFMRKKHPFTWKAACVLIFLSVSYCFASTL